MRTRIALLTTLIACAAAVPSAAQAADCSFQGPGAAWNDAANWDCMAIPGAGDTAAIGPGDSVLVGTAESVLALDLSGGALTVTSGNLSAAALSASGGALTVSGTGAMTGPASANFTGVTIALEGSYTGGIALVTGSVLMGGGVLNGSLTNAGTVRPGLSPGQLDVNGDYTQAAGGALEIEVQGPFQGSAYDYLKVTGAATLGGTLTILQGSGYPEPTVVDVFSFLESGSRTGTFATVGVPALPNGKRYQVQYPGSPTFGARLVVVQSPQNTTAPTADGVTSAGSPLSCSTGNWAGTPAPSFSVEWLRDGQPVPGATQASYTIADADAQHALSCRVTATNEVGSALATSAARDIGAVAPDLVEGPSVSGAPQPGSVLSCVTGSWSGFPAPALSIDWLRDGQPAGNDPQYTVSPQDAGHSIACHVTAGNGAGSKDAISGALGVAKSAEQLLSESSTSTVAGKIGLPSSTACLKERYLRLRVRQPSGVRISAVAVLGNGKKNKANKTAGRFNSTFDLRHVTKKTLTVRITVTTASGRKATGERRYRICLPKRKPAKKR